MLQAENEETGKAEFVHYLNSSGTSSGKNCSGAAVLELPRRDGSDHT